MVTGPGSIEEEGGDPDERGVEPVDAGEHFGLVVLQPPGQGVSDGRTDDDARGLDREADRDPEHEERAGEGVLLEPDLADSAKHHQDR